MIYVKKNTGTYVPVQLYDMLQCFIELLLLPLNQISGLYRQEGG